jgi:hypothetical protein
VSEPANGRASSGGRYQSLHNFYLADSRRVTSRERDVGLWWRDDARGPLHRAAWVRETGELYVVRLGPDESGGGQVEILGVARDRNELEDVLRGWHDVCGEVGSLTWLRRRAARLARPQARKLPSPEMSDIALAGRRLEEARAAFAYWDRLAHEPHFHKPGARHEAKANARYWRAQVRAGAPRVSEADGRQERLLTRVRAALHANLNARLVTVIGALVALLAPTAAIILELAQA